MSSPIIVSRVRKGACRTWDNSAFPSLDLSQARDSVWQRGICATRCIMASEEGRTGGQPPTMGWRSVNETLRLTSFERARNVERRAASSFRFWSRPPDMNRMLDQSLGWVREKSRQSRLMEIVAPYGARLISSSLCI